MTSQCSGCLALENLCIRRMLIQTYTFTCFFVVADYAAMIICTRLYYTVMNISWITAPVKSAKCTSTSFFTSCRRFSHTQSKLLWSAVAHRENTGLAIEITWARIPFATHWHFRSLSCISEYLAIDGGGNVSEWHRCQHQRTKKRERVDEKA